MLRDVIALFACVLGASSASAQFVTGPGMIGNPGGPAVLGPKSNSIDNVPQFGDRTSPAARVERLKKALALREQAYAWQSQDGGSLSMKHKNLINRGAMTILSN